MRSINASGARQSPSARAFSYLSRLLPPNGRGPCTVVIGERMALSAEAGKQSLCVSLVAGRGVLVGF